MDTHQASNTENQQASHSKSAGNGNSQSDRLLKLEWQVENLATKEDVRESERRLTENLAREINSANAQHREDLKDLRETIERLREMIERLDAERRKDIADLREKADTTNGALSIIKPFVIGVCITVAAFAIVLQPLSLFLLLIRKSSYP